MFCFTELSSLHVAPVSATLQRNACSDGSLISAALDLQNSLPFLAQARCQAAHLQQLDIMDVILMELVVSLGAPTRSLWFSMVFAVSCFDETCCCIL